MNKGQGVHEIQEMTKSLHKFFLKERVQVSWRPQVRKSAMGSDSKPFVPYIEVGEVRRILRKAVIEGLAYDWTAEYEILPPDSGGSSPEENKVYVRCTLKLFIMTSGGPYALQRQDIGEGSDLKAAFSDSLKRAALHYGIGAVLEKLETQYLHDLRREANRLEALIEEAYRQIYVELGEEPLASPKPSPSKNPDGTEDLGGKPPSQGNEKEADIWERLERADIMIGELLDELPSKGRIEVLRLMKSLGWKRGVFSEGTPEERESLLQALGGLEKAIEKAKAIYQEAKKASKAHSSS